MKSEHLWLYMSLRIISLVCACVCFSTSALSHAASSGKLPSHQLCYSPQPSLRTADNVTHPGLEPLLSSRLLPSPLSLSFCIPVICLCAWFSSLDWLTWESQWHRCPRAKTRLDEQRHTFLPLSPPRWVPPPCVWSYLCLPITGDADWVSAAEDCLQLDHAKTPLRPSSVSFAWKQTWDLLFLREASNYT